MPGKGCLWLLEVVRSERSDARMSEYSCLDEAKAIFESKVLDSLGRRIGHVSA